MKKKDAATVTPPLYATPPSVTLAPHAALKLSPTPFQTSLYSNYYALHVQYVLGAPGKENCLETPTSTNMQNYAALPLNA